MKTQNTLCGILLVSAVVLSVLLVLSYFPGPARTWAGDASRAGYFAVATATVDGDSDLLWLANVDQQLLAVYGIDNTGTIQLLARADLIRVFEDQTMAIPITPLPATPIP